MALASNKKVLVSRFDRESLQGFVQTPAGLEGDAVELLRPEGSVVRVPFAETKLVCFVRDFEAGETWQEHRAFATRPKTAGLWVRFRLRDGDWLEGILPNNLLQIEAAGFNAVPADPSYQNQRIFVPRLALSGVEVLGVIGSSLRRRPAKKPGDDGQLKMF
jgi:uncharacterized protein DUF6982